MVRTGYHDYQQTDVITAEPRRLVIMCYEGAIQSLKLAQAKYLNGDFEGKAKAIHKTLAIIHELRQALDFDKGKEIARHLENLYTTWSRQIVVADRRRDLPSLGRVAGMMGEIKSAFEEAFFGQIALQSATPSSAGLDYPPQSGKTSLAFESRG
jgi:flagellar secretion chaperone FliS